MIPSDRTNPPARPRALSSQQAALIKGMLARGDRQSDIAAYFSCNQGRVAEISTGAKFAEVIPASADQLPPRGPYRPGSSIQ